MGTVFNNMRADFISEFTLMNNQTYPYTNINNKDSVVVNIINSGGSFTIDTTAYLKFTNSLGQEYPYIFKPVLPSGPVVIGGARVIPSTDPNEPDTIIPTETSLFFDTVSSEVTLLTSDIGKLYVNDVLVSAVTIEHKDIIAAEHQFLYYFIYRVTMIIANNIDSAHFFDSDHGDENPGIGALEINFNSTMEAVSFGFDNVLYMQEHPSTDNSKITGTLVRTSGSSRPGYLDIIVNDFFYYALNDYHYVSHLTYNNKDADQLCAELNSLSSQGPPYITVNEATILSADMMTGIIDSYCNDDL